LTKIISVIAFKEIVANISMLRINLFCLVILFWGLTLPNQMANEINIVRIQESSPPIQAEKISSDSDIHSLHKDSLNYSNESCEEKITFTASGTKDLFEIKVMNPDGTNIQNLSNNAAVDSDPTWSADGKQIAFVSRRDAGFSLVSNIFLMKADGTEVVQLTKGLGSCRYPDWSPDGKMIVFNHEFNHRSDIDVINSDGTGFKQLVSNGKWNSQPAWSPDGKQIAFVSADWDSKEKRRGTSDIYIMKSDGSGINRLTSSSADDFSPAWSPDGKMLAFVSKRKGSADIFIVDLEIQIAKQMTPGADSVEDHPTWSPDGETIAFDSTRDNPFGDIYKININGGSWERITFSIEHEMAWQPNWSHACK
jgi:Tol biopolymer transport system component